MQTKQINEWTGDFGKEYLLRNTFTAEELDSTWKGIFGLTRTEMNAGFLNDLDRNIRILEVGCNVGNQLACLEKMGFNNLYGIEIFADAVEIARSRGKAQVIKGSAFDIPFKDNYFDLVFTSSVLIHINPADLLKATSEICRVSKKYIFGFEYYADSFEEINYRGKTNLLWKGNYPQIYCDNYDMESIKIEKYKYLENNNKDVMYLLKKVTRI